MLLAAWWGVDAFLTAAGFCVLVLGGGTLSFGMGLHGVDVFAMSVTQFALLFAVGMVGLPLARWREEKAAERI